MRRGSSGLIAAAVVVPALAFPATAQDAGAGGSDLGRITYALHCATCHGAGGQGDGAMAAFLDVAVPDLTAIQRANGGVFPFARVYGIIENGADNPVHAASPMPRWRDELVTQTALLQGIEVPPAQREPFVRVRILALIDHIAQLQAQ
jgi:mono/diheme cytochrome c family protein